MACFRSEEMQLLQLFVQSEAAHDTVDELGKLGLMQFKDMNPAVNAFQRAFVTDVKRCDDMERKLRFFQEQIEKAKIPLGAVDENMTSLSMDELEAKFGDLEREVRDMVGNEERLDKNYYELVEWRHVLEQGDYFFEDVRSQVSNFQNTIGTAPEDIRAPLLDEEEAQAKARAVKLGFVSGVVLQERLTAFERILFRATRGNMYMKYANPSEAITDPFSNEPVEKSVFIIFFSGDRLRTKITKICESFNAHLYKYPEAHERGDMQAKLDTQLGDLMTVIDQTKRHRNDVLTKLAVELNLWMTKVKKEKAIYHCLNLFNYDTSRKCLIAEGWVPSLAIEEVQLALRRATTSSQAQVPSIMNVLKTNEMPPTKHVSNKYTDAFQELIDAFGMAQYREMNPAPFSVITFPFLFAVMYGDVGHGLLVLLFAAYLIYKEKEWSKIQLNEMVKMAFQGRYVIFLMGVFSIYTGLIYNEFLSVPADLFGTMWEYQYTNSTIATRIPGVTYPFGVDPVWHHTVNGLIFTNSMKMKMSIILGVTQMTVGIMLSLFNAIYFRRWINIYCEFIPQMIFLMSTFGYLCILIIAKWNQPWNVITPPSLTATLINFFMKMGSTEGVGEIFNGQQTLQGILLAFAFISVPWMLVPKPFILKREHEQRVAMGYGNSSDDPDEHFDFSEVFVHQVIHSIEFILGCVSNTASYLRLWALSLAHAQLSIVFWEQIMIVALKSHNAIFIFVGFSVWAAMTFAVLLVMETLSAFLHDLRLHWVEFMNKFYAATGTKFIPFSYEKLFKVEE
eukprot:GFYU01003875.1.p1 GENE.GFYU01003875.1~~GFYU01003875.1.p1  ORF type:complete len:789 (-),score=277.14 GFYU01003875.1:293-2659(-)